MEPHTSPRPDSPPPPGAVPTDALPTDAHTADALTSLSAVRIAAGVRAGELRALDVVAAALARIERAEPTLCAFVEVWAEEALRRAGEVDVRVAAGVWLPLAGVPIGVKGRSGLRTAAARALVAAGCVPVGATSVPGPGTPWQTWGLGSGGRTVNPWRADRTPGGSSAGSAAAVAAGLVPMATGTDGAGSVRIPAAWCGIVGLKSTNGLLPSADRTGLASAGVLTRHASDAAAYWRCMTDAAEAARESEAAAGSGPNGDGRKQPSPPGTAEATRAAADGDATPAAGTGAAAALGASADTPRPAQAVPAGDRAPAPPVAVWSDDLGFADVEPGIAAIARAAALRLADAGLVRQAPSPPWSAGPRTRREPGALTLEDPGPAWLTLRAGARVDPAHLRAAREVRAENDRRLAALFAEADLILTPTTPNPPHGHDGPGDRYSTALTWAFNLSGHPALSIPAGFDADGCPVGLQLVARDGEEALLLRVAEAAEAVQA
ncbi:amidase family protein [Streptomyces akebiae]|uniref:Amidase n=1 Tax=Streptomyces akebiae TaxID=2865673 RepID=A0ABX8XRF0_9ACTN|nr:amidase family protein [Streptomyces akebiae]QYX78139.1 amidase [Streptomyces akebiae]